jgi:general secretion pathway protein G
MKKQRNGFTLIELLVVIAIIGILSTLAVVALQNARKSARDVKRLADVRQIQTALELYLNDWGTYPLPDENDSLGDSIATGGITYMARVPDQPTPLDGEACANFYDLAELSTDLYYYALDDNNYFIILCLGGPTGGLQPGLVLASPNGFENFNIEDL